MRKFLVLVGLFIVAMAGTAAAQAGAAHPGYYPVEAMGIFAQGDLEVDVNLSGAMLKVAAGAMENQDESLGELVANLERVRVQVGTPSDVDASKIARTIADAQAKLGSAGWQKILSLEETDEQVSLFALESGDRIAGLTAFVYDVGEDVVVVNIVGDIDPRTLGRLLANIKEVDLDELMEAVEQ